ncbi:MAG: manganese efflux pump [bacterium]|nr:manganese efflux pump MntP family protein [Mycoplasmatota bacterium]MDD6757535.1 manganese efflux pump [bacterium]MDY2908336.1 manganese efflux pump [Candidatus Faecimonas sp.]
MNNILIYFVMAIGLSMDAFSLALAYGTTKIPINKKVLLSITVGIFHFFMPKLGALIGTELLLNYIAKANYLVGIIFLILAIEMLLSRKEEKTGSITNMISIILFSFTVSIDSFSVGIALSLTTTDINSPCIIFALISTLFTFLGVELGSKIAYKFENKAEYIGIIILLILGIKYLIL